MSMSGVVTARPQTRERQQVATPRTPLAERQARVASTQGTFRASRRLESPTPRQDMLGPSSAPTVTPHRARTKVRA